MNEKKILDGIRDDFTDPDPVYALVTASEPEVREVEKELHMKDADLTILVHRLLAQELLAGRPIHRIKRSDDFQRAIKLALEEYGIARNDTISNEYVHNLSKIITTSSARRDWNRKNMALSANLRARTSSQVVLAH